MLEDLKSLCFDAFKIVFAVVLLENAFNNNESGVVVDVIWAWVFAFGLLFAGFIFSFFIEKIQRRTK